MANNHVINNVTLPIKTTCVANNIKKTSLNHHFQTSIPSKPLHIRRIEQAVNVGPFLNNFTKENASQQSSSSSSDSDSNHDNNERRIDELLEDEPHSVKDYFNLKNVSLSRQWLVDVLASENGADSEPEEAPYKYLLNMHAYQKKLRKNKEVNFDQSMFYGAGLISVVDHYPDIEREVVISKISKKKPVPVVKQELNKSPPLYYDSDILNIPFKDESCINFNLDNGLHEYPTFDGADIEAAGGSSDFNGVNLPAEIIPMMPPTSNPMLSSSHHRHNHHHHPPTVSKRKSKKFKDEDAKRKWEEIMGNKRRKLFTNIVKKEVNKQHRAKTNKHKEMLLCCKRVASHCVKYARQKALQSARTVKEQQWRMKRLARESIAYWKRSRRFDREVKKRLEKEAEEQRKMDHELIEAKRQQRKLNFLITQTELYAHFMSKKLGRVSPEEQLRILSQLDEDQTIGKATKLIDDDYDCEAMKEQARRNAQDAFQSEKARTKKFDQQANSCLLSNVENVIDNEQPQPEIFKGMLKGYQLKGMNWLANLYSQGISGILADEMGLGKTVQSIAFLCHIAEKYSVWGPFLIISPASTLHNWQQEIAKFVPDFKVVPYWGSPNERKILRQFWDQKDIYTKDASFHIVVTSYQIVITDIKYFNRIKWQYMILDEAQAIKSTSSMRWKTLLGFSCRNRLLLSGTPIQNSMAELWALLHFIMPTLFDSHDEFNEWFSKDIESHAENRTGIDEKHLSRLHMILKPFMLRRIKKDVENELSDKIEIMVYCPLTPRQNLLYLALKKKIKIEDLLHYSVGGSGSGSSGGGGNGDPHGIDKNFTSNLMNLVMQFRKVCNHPELFERRDAKSPFRFRQIAYEMPYLIYDTNIRLDIFLKLNIHPCFTAKYISEMMWSNSRDTLFNFLICLDLSINDLLQILLGNITVRWRSYFEFENNEEILYLRKLWDLKTPAKIQLNCKHQFKLSNVQIENSDILKELVFTRNIYGNRIIYTHQRHTYHSMPETIEHKNIRYKKQKLISGDDENGGMDDEVDFPNFIHIPRTPLRFECEKTELPSYLTFVTPKVSTSPVKMYCYSRRAAWDMQRHIDDYSYDSLNFYWSQAIGKDFPIPSAAASFYPSMNSCMERIRPAHGWSNIIIPDKENLVTDSGKLFVLDGLLKRLKEEGHRVLIYSQMTRMIDLLEEYMWHRHHKYMRLDGSSKISERRDMVADFQARADIFVFLLSTRAGGLGINLTAADTVIFYDSDWNPTVDQQAMDRAHRLGQTKQVTVYRLICKGSIEERILQRAREKSEIQKLVISGGNFKPDTLKPKEVVSLLLDDDELIQKYHLKVETKSSTIEDLKEDRKRKVSVKPTTASGDAKKPRLESPNTVLAETKEEPTSPQPSSGEIDIDVASLDGHQSDQAAVIEDDDSPITNKYTVYNVYGSAVRLKNTGRGQSKRGRPRGSRSRAVTNSNVRPVGSVVATTTVGASLTSSSVTTATASGSTITTSGSTSSFGENIDSSSSTQSSPRNEVSGADNGSGGSLVGNGISNSRSRGPGRPRLYQSGPSQAGLRTTRPRKAVRSLPIPLHSDLLAQQQQQQPHSSSKSFSTSDYLDE